MSGTYLPGPAGVWLLARCADLQGLEYDVRRFGLCLLALFGLGLLFRCWGHPGGRAVQSRPAQFAAQFHSVGEDIGRMQRPEYVLLAPSSTNTLCRATALLAMFSLHRDKQR